METVICIKCGEEVYSHMLVQHHWKDHDNGALEREESLVAGLMREGLSLNTIMSLVDFA